jgi:serine/threonine-protein kinase
MKVCPTCQNEYPENVEFCPTDGTKLRARRGEEEDPLIGRALDGRWIVEEKLGEGGMGSVYKGHQRSVNRTVAIKTLRPQLVDSEEFVDRFFREAQIAGNISHPHCVTILDYGESDDGTLFLAMEFLDGEALTDRLEAGSMPVKQVIEVGIQVASALSAAHEQSIVHRDLKPDNIFLIDVPGGATFAKVLDFGIAKMLDSNTQMTKTGMIFGTPEYMSPEQCRGGEIDGRSDLYSLGCILYELVGGRTPFRGTTPMAVLMAHVNQKAPSLAEGDTAAHVPPTFERVIMQLIEKDPEHRFQTAAEVREALEAELQRLDSFEPGAPVPDAEAATGPREVVADPVEIGFDETVGLQSTERPAPQDTAPVEGDFDEFAAPQTGDRRGTLIAIAVVAVLAVVVVGGALIWVAMSDSPTDEDGQVSDPTIASVEESPPEPPSEEPIVAEPAADEPTEDTGEPVENDDEDSLEPAVAAKVDTAEAPPKERKDEEPAPTKKKSTRKPIEDPAPKPTAAPKKTKETTTADEDEPEEKPKPRKKKPKKRLGKKLDDLNKKTEKAKQDIEKSGKGIASEAEKVFEGLMEP